jgi:hypothetical protein
MWKEREAARHFFPALQHLHSHRRVNARQSAVAALFPSFILTMRIILYLAKSGHFSASAINQQKLEHVRMPNRT